MSELIIEKNIYIRFIMCHRLRILPMMYGIRGDYKEQDKRVRNIVFIVFYEQTEN